MSLEALIVFAGIQFVTLFAGYSKGHRDGYQRGFIRGRWTK